MNNNLKIIICPNEYKLRLLEDLNRDNILHNYKFMTKEEFLKNYYFDYDENTLYYLMNKYNYNLDVAKVYLKNMYVIDTNKDYKSSKLNLLKELKIDLISNNLLKFNNIFRDHIKDKEIIIKNYYDLDEFEEELFNYKFNIPDTKLNTKVYEYNDIESEVNGVCLKIIDLINKGISLDKIYLTNISKDYYFIINKLFNYYKIPININFNDCIYNTKVVKEYLSTGLLDLEDNNKSIINKKLINIISNLSMLDSNSKIYKIILKDRLKHTYFPSKKYKNAVNIVNLSKYSFRDDEYVFVLGFNQDILPTIYKDIDYINDSIKDEVNMYKTSYLNRREKNIIIYLLSKIKNLSLSYKLSTPFRSFYRSSLIDELNLEIIKEDKDNYSYSNLYNKIRLGEKLDKYYLYGEKDNYLDILNNHYHINYKTYNNSFTGINNNSYLKYIKKPIRLAYTSLNSYNECSFKYYINYVLKLGNYEDTFATFIGSMYHYILTLYKNNNFDFEKEWNSYLEKRDLSLSEKLLLVKIKKDLLDLIEVEKKYNLITGFDNEKYEVKCSVKLEDLDSEFIGFIDKIMFIEKNNNTYFSIIDYKTGSIDTHIEAMKYGLHMQLPIYLYLINKTKIFNNPIFTGIYYQNILFNYPTWSSHVEKDIKDRYKLVGYSTDDTYPLEIFDSTMENSELIKSMKYDGVKGFGTYTKLIDNNTYNELIDYTERLVNEKSKDIIDGKFEINPKVYDKDNVACKFCKFRDLCFMKEKDLVYLEKQDDLSFLGGEE